MVQTQTEYPSKVLGRMLGTKANTHKTFTARAAFPAHHLSENRLSEDPPRPPKFLHQAQKTFTARAAPHSAPLSNQIE